MRWTGFGHLLTNLRFGTMPGESTEARQGRFATGALDRLRSEQMALQAAE